MHCLFQQIVIFIIKNSNNVFYLTHIQNAIYY